MTAPDGAAVIRAGRDAAARRRAAVAAQTARVARAVAPRLLPATVVRVAAGTGVDGDDVCWVVFDAFGTQVDVPYPDGYTPQVGHEVELLVQDGEPRILHRLRGISKPPDPDELEV